MNKMSPLQFLPNKIYEFKIDFYKTKQFGGIGFYDYCKVLYDSTDNNYKIYSYYPWNGKLRPTKPTRENKYSGTIEFLREENNIFFFKGPIFSNKLSFRFGQYDEWIVSMNNSFEITE